MTDLTRSGRQDGPESQLPAWGVRPFGLEPTDLDVDFRRQPPPRIVSAILSACVGSAGKGTQPDGIPDDWTVHRRLQSLLAVTIATCGRCLEITERCSAAGCGGVMDMTLDLVEFQRPVDAPAVRLALKDGPELHLRIPSGADQLRWIEARDPTGSFDPCRMARDLVTAIDGMRPPEDWQLSDRWLPEIDAAFEVADPLTSLELNSQCPHCETSVVIPFDLEAALLEALAKVPVRVLEEIHQIANAYHWSEGVILALPPARRQFYLRRIEERSDP